MHRWAPLLFYSMQFLVGIGLIIMALFFSRAINEHLNMQLSDLFNFFAPFFFFSGVEVDRLTDDHLGKVLLGPVERVALVLLD